jgi:hypothetical protein
MHAAHAASMEEVLMRSRSTHVQDRPAVDDPRYRDDPRYVDDPGFSDDPRYSDDPRSTQVAGEPLPPPSRVDAPPVATVRDPDAPVEPALYDDRAVVTDTRSVRRFSPASIVGAIAGLALVVVGVVAITRAGTSGPMDQPVVSVAGFNHTAVLGIVEIVAGGLMLLAAVSRSRGALFLVALIVCGAAIAAAIEPSIGGDSTAIESTFAVIVAVGAGFVAFLAAILPNVTTAKRTMAVH